MAVYVRAPQVPISNSSPIIAVRSAGWIKHIVPAARVQAMMRGEMARPKVRMAMNEKMRGAAFLAAGFL